MTKVEKSLHWIIFCKSWLFQTWKSISGTLVFLVFNGVYTKKKHWNILKVLNNNVILLFCTFWHARKKQQHNIVKKKHLELFNVYQKNNTKALKIILLKTISIKYWSRPCHDVCTTLAKYDICKRMVLQSTSWPKQKWQYFKFYAFVLSLIYDLFWWYKYWLKSVNTNRYLLL